MTSVMIWAPAGPDIGAGHFMRTMALAGALAVRRSQVRLYAPPATQRFLRDRPIDFMGVEITPVADFDDAVAHCMRERVDWAVVDDYRRDARDERKLRASGARILAIDDLADRPHECDALLDAMPYRRAADYDGLVPPAAARWIGLDFALVSPSFAARREASRARRARPSLGTILVTFGLAHAAAGFAPALAAIAAADVAERIAVLAPTDAAAAALCRDHAALAARLDIQVGCTDPAAAFAAADLAICAPGVTTLELCALGVPMVLLVTRPHQRQLADDMARRGAAVSFDGTDASASALVETLHELAHDPARLEAMSAAAASAVDGQGAARVADQLILATAE